MYSKTKKGKGDNMAITSESQMIDISTIDAGCKIIEEAARDYTTCAGKVKEAASICTSEALSVEKKSMQPALDDLGTSIETIESNILYFTSQIRNVAMQIHTQQYNELTEYKMRKAAEEQKRQEEAAKAAQQTTTTTN